VFNLFKRTGVSTQNDVATALEAIRRGEDVSFHKFFGESFIMIIRWDSAGEKKILLLHECEFDTDHWKVVRDSAKSRSSILFQEEKERKKLSNRLQGFIR